MNTIALADGQTVVIAPRRKRSVYAYSLGELVASTIVLVSVNQGEREITLRVHLRGSGAKAVIIGIVVGRSGSRLLLHTHQYHEAPRATSDLLIKSVLHDKSTFEYDGGIRVDENAQQTDAYQRNENLLIGVDAYARSDPALEILANDVRCTHGATTSPLADDQVWYLASRGISASRAQRLLIRGFLTSALENISDETVRSSVWQKIEAAL